MRRLFFTSPVDQRNLAEWPALARRLVQTIGRACSRKPLVEAGTEPICGYDIDLEETLLGLEQLEFDPGTIRIDLWSSIVHYGVLGITLGSGIVRKERRAVTKALVKALRPEKLIHEEEGQFDRYAGRVYGYRLDPDDDRDRSSLAQLMMIFDPPMYIGERWLLQNSDEAIDSDDYYVYQPAQAPVLRFNIEPDAATGAEERVWSHAARGRGLIAAYADDDDRQTMVRNFTRQDDLRWLVGGERWNYRVTIGRGRAEDHLAITYDLQVEPPIEAEVLFVF